MPENLLFVGVGVVAFWIVRRVIGLYERHTPRQIQTPVLWFGQNWLALLLLLGYFGVFLASAGATALHWFVRPFVDPNYLPDTSWGPSGLFTMLLGWALGKYFEQHEPQTEELPIRGRQMKAPRPGSEQFTGRTIRTYRNEE
jgi:hypothetical protein